MSSDALFGERPSEGLKRRAVRGAFAVGGSQAAKIVLQFVSVGVLARLLSPHDFGLVAMVTPLIGFSLLFQDFGLTQALVTSPKLTQPEAARIFSINLMLSFGVAAVVALCSPLLAYFYREPSLVGLTIGLAVQIVLAAAAASHLALLTRCMRFNALSCIEVVAAAAGLAAASAYAFFNPSPWALVVQSTTTALAMMLMSWFTTKWRPSQPAPLKHVRSMLHFGMGMTTFNLTNFLSRNADNVMIGWSRGSLELGLYDRAYKLLLFPLQQINRPIGAIMVPVLSRIVDEPERYRAAYRRTLQITMLATMPGMLFLIVSAPVLIPFLLGGQRWAAAVPIFMWLGVAGLHQTISNTFGWLFVSQRRTSEYARFGMFSAASCIIAFAVGLRWGAQGVAAAYGLSGIMLRLPAIIWQVGRSGPVTARDIIKIAAPYAFAAGITALVWRLALPILPREGLPHLFASAAVTFAAFLAVISIFRCGREALREAFGIIPFGILRRKSVV